MYCKNCGADLGTEAKFCPECGTKVEWGASFAAKADDALDTAKEAFDKAAEEITENTDGLTDKIKNEFNKMGDDLEGLMDRAEQTIDNMAQDAGEQFRRFTGGEKASSEGGTMAGAAAGAAGAAAGSIVCLEPYDQYQQQGKKTLLPTDRSFGLYIVLNLITCGIYGYWYIYRMAHDVNIVCDGDGQKTTGLAGFLLLSIITCGIYAYWWYYTLGNRLAENAPRFGIVITETGADLLLWIVLGLLTCGLLSLVAMYILIKNTNAICKAYNEQ